MSTKEYLADTVTRHSLFVQRYASGRERQAVTVLNRVRKTIVARLLDEPTTFQRNRLEALLNDIKIITNRMFGEYSVQTMEEVQKFASLEAEFSTKLFNKASKASFALPSSSQLTTALIIEPMEATMVGGATSITDALSIFGKRKSIEIMKTINDGILLGDTTPQIAKSLSEVMRTTQAHNIRTLARTVTNSASAIAREQVMMENSELLDGYEFLATLDSNTTTVCASHDSKIYQVGNGPKPPLHWGCRSTILPIVKKEYDLGAEVTGQRSSHGSAGPKPVSGKTTYGSWLRRQSKSFQVSALGEDRAKLFRDGKMPIDSFVDPTGEEYSLETLRGMFPVAFERAKL